MAKKTQFHIGTSGWTYDAWRGAFYPEDLPKSRWLTFYTCYFNAIEMNATFYQFFKPENYIKWRDSVPENFYYIVKVPRVITHYKFLVDCEEVIHHFLELANLLEDKLGLLLLQLPPNMPYDPSRLEKALLAFDDPTKVVVEFRNQKWMTPEVKKLLTNIGCVFCDADSPKSKLLGWVTSDTAYIRLHGRKSWYDYDYSKKQLAEIAQHAKRLAKKGARTVYIMFNNDYEAYAVKNALYLKKLLKKR